MDTRKVIIPASIIVIIVVAAFGFYIQTENTFPKAPPAPEETVKLPAAPALKPVSSKETPQKPPARVASPVGSADFLIGHKADEEADVIHTETIPVVSLPKGIVAMVNGVAITKAELDEEFNKLLISPRSHTGVAGEKKKELRNLALQELVIRELAFQEAKALRLKAKRKEVNDSFERIRKRYKTEKDFKEALKTENMTEKDLKDRIERDLLLEKINKVEIEDRARVSEKEARKHYESNKAKFLTPESVRLWNIVTRFKEGKEAEAKKKIDKAYKLLESGKNFEGVAYKYSEDDYSFLGGDYGWIHRGQLARELEDIIFSAKENEITGPFRTSFGWHIIKVGALRQEKQLEYKEVKEKIKDGLFKRRLRKARIDFINKLRARANIRYAAGAN